MIESASRKSIIRGTLAVVATVFIASATYAAAPSPAPSSLEAGFQDPPSSARPRVWWHWMNGNITKDGIRKDLEWMKRTGIGGAQNFDANLMTPKVVEQRLAYMTPEWKDAFRFAASLADKLGLELAIASSAGWSETGGPSVPPEDGMKKLVWSETSVAGGKPFTGVLAQPPGVTGPFQAMPFFDPMGGFGGNKAKALPAYYADTAVVAFPVEDDDEPTAPTYAASDGTSLDAAVFTDGNYDKTLAVNRGTAEQPGALVARYEKRQAIRSVTVFIAGKTSFSDIGLAPRLEASDDGQTWRNVAEVPVGTIPTTVSFDAVKARQFRLMLLPAAPKALDMGSAAPGAIGAEIVTAMTAGSTKPAQIAEFRLSTEPKVDRFETKAGFSVQPDYYALDSSAKVEIDGVRPAKVVDLTTRMKPDGTLDWTPPRGHWRVLRFGYSLVGKTNHPATPEATGLEVDKMDAPAVRRYLETYLKSYQDTVGSELLGAHGVRALLTDSIEVGPATWTPRMLEQFQRLRGYDPVPWLPTLAGVVVGSRRESDAFLYDFRRTIADLIASEHYATVATVAHEHGLRLYGEALEDHRPMLGDDIAMRSHADVPMAAMWTYASEKNPKPTYLADIKGAASVAHAYGQNVVAAESMTSMLMPWAHAPNSLRRVIDLEFATGVNLPVIHTSVHQPLDDKIPGMTLFFFGQYFNRHETWAEMARPWIDYIARNSFLLQQGRNVADLAYFHGEEAPLTSLFGDHVATDVPVRYAYDFVNADIILNLMSVQDGALVTKGGARYKALYLGGSSRRMTLPALRQLEKLAEAGATIVGTAPESSPSLNDDRDAFEKIVHRLWNGKDITKVGAGQVIASTDAEAALASIGVGPDFSYVKAQPDSEVLFAHRRLDDGDLYFLSNRRNREEQFEASFRVTGKAPEIWRADTGAQELASYRVDGDKTVVSLDMDAEESFFVVFRKDAASSTAAVSKTRPVPVTTIEGPWKLAFQKDRGAPASTQLASLASLSENENPGIKYFSGITTYRNTFALPKGVKPGDHLLLDLGQVCEIAEVRVNGKMLGTVWHAPYRVDVGAAIRRGRNQLEIRVVDLWVNRLIGDKQEGVTKKITFVSQPAYRATAPLRSSGLIGPVQLLKAD